MMVRSAVFQQRRSTHCRGSVFTSGYNMRLVSTRGRFSNGRAFSASGLFDNFYRSERDMKTATRVVGMAALGLAALALGGCVIAVGDEAMDKHHDRPSLQDQISRLELGSEFAKVRDQLGAPERTEAFKSCTAEYRILRYRGGSILVFKDGRLAGIGDNAQHQALSDPSQNCPK
jgi:hypothetical protein